jgi:hypothetical protein
MRRTFVLGLESWHICNMLRTTGERVDIRAYGVPKNPSYAEDKNAEGRLLGLRCIAGCVPALLTRVFMTMMESHSQRQGSYITNVAGTPSDARNL